MKKLSYLAVAAALVMGFGLSGVANAQTVLTKEITMGDIAIQIKKTTTTPYEYTLTYVPAPGDPENVVIIDTVPAEWDVTSIDGVPNLPLDCGGSETAGNLDLNRGGKAGKKCSSATKFAWTLTPSQPSQTVIVGTETRESPATIKHTNKTDKFKPTSCGKLALNDGAQAFEANPDGTLVLDLDGNPIPVGDPSNSLMLVAVDDLNGLGIVADGTGDEDGDGISDYDEVRFDVVTDPCNPDTDGDGVNDGVDACPLEGLEVTGFVDASGCPVTP